MEQPSREFLDRLLATPGPSGFEAPVQRVVRDYVGPIADQIETDWHGNLVAGINAAGTPRIMLDAHCDQIGLMVRHIDDGGFIRVSPIGGWDVQMLIGQRLCVWTAHGPIDGVIARKPIHLLTTEERKQVPEMPDLWLDIGSRNEKETRRLVALGDPVTFELGYRELRNNRIAGPCMDNRTGVWVIMQALRLISEGTPTAGVFAASTVQEEIGLRGAKTSAYTIDPQIGIAVDVTHATDCPSINFNEHGVIAIGKGPVLVRGPNVNPIVFKRLLALAEEHDIPVQINALSKPASNDGNAIQVSRGGLATGLVTIPNRYMHSPVEMVSLDDMQHAAELIAKFCLSVTADCDFTPGC